MFRQAQLSSSDKYYLQKNNIFLTVQYHTIIIQLSLYFFFFSILPVLLTFW